MWAWELTRAGELLLAITQGAWGTLRHWPQVWRQPQIFRANALGALGRFWARQLLPIALSAAGAQGGEHVGRDFRTTSCWVPEVGQRVTAAFLGKTSQCLEASGRGWESVCCHGGPLWALRPSPGLWQCRFAWRTALSLVLPRAQTPPLWAPLSSSGLGSLSGSMWTPGGPLRECVGWGREDLC